MKIISLILILFSLVSFNIYSFAAESDTSEPAAGTVENAVASSTAQQEEGLIIRKLRGRISTVDVTKKTFKLTPNNIGEPISVMCDPTSSCSVASLVEGIDGNAEIFYLEGKWVAKSVDQIS